MGHSKTNVTGREKIKHIYLNDKDEPVTPVMINGQMWWQNEQGERVKNYSKHIQTEWNRKGDK